jgi:long-chain fatty acid transport protein
VEGLRSHKAMDIVPVCDLVGTELKKIMNGNTQWPIKAASHTCGGGSCAALLLAVLSWTAWAPDAGALGVRVPNQDASAIARGNAFVATADNPAAIYYNPAGITQLEGHNLQLGSLVYLGIYGTYDSPTHARTENTPQALLVPSLNYVFTPTNFPLSFGFGVYEPFGFRVEWPNHAPFRQEGTDATLNYVTLNPVVAWKIVPALSISVGPTFNYSQFDVTQGVTPDPNMPPGNRFHFKDDNWGYGFNAGLLWQPLAQWSFGASYRSSTRLNYQGNASLQPSPPLPALGSSSLKVDFPQVVIGGVSYRPNTNWNIEVDVDWTDWSSFKEFAIQKVPAQTLDWRSSFMYEIGVTRYLRKGYYLSAGYFYSVDSTSDEHYTPLVPDSDLHIASVGGGFRGLHWSWALAFQAIFGESHFVNHAADPNVDGRYQIFTPTLSLSLGYHF